MDPVQAGELRSLLASARSWLEECLEEGLDRIERPLPTAPAPRKPVEEEPALASPTAAQSTALPTPGPLTQTRPDLAQVRATLGECTRCALSEKRTQIVFGDGNPDADILFVGEGPGEQEDLRGLPFVGRAGELLTQMIEKGMGLARQDVYICNIVKCRPPGNRNPLPTEVNACRPFLDGQIDAVAPRVIVSLGKPAASLLLGRDVAITRVRGTWHEYRGIALMPTLHPAYLLRQYTAENRRWVWEDLKSALARSGAG
uniref:Type-4 uracil-DNA glycosylase n=1 Tax=uncultured myxobacterium HF0200_01L06 TaxID=723556 RepID=E7C3H7_9BACT|nr:uracil-DNA glycosylase [uncultured myxobacterium HF0200_01L06]